MDKDNANPTILTASQLPTRQSKPRKDKKTVAQQNGVNNSLEDTLGDTVMLGPADVDLLDDFCDAPWSDDTESDDDFTFEPIDEQEIYGKKPVRYF